LRRTIEFNLARSTFGFDRPTPTSSPWILVAATCSTPPKERPSMSMSSMDTEKARIIDAASAARSVTVRGGRKVPSVTRPTRPLAIGPMTWPVTVELNCCAAHGAPTAMALNGALSALESPGTVPANATMWLRSRRKGSMIGMAIQPSLVGSVRFSSPVRPDTKWNLPSNRRVSAMREPGRPGPASTASRTSVLVASTIAPAGRS
jgi:hypothetical protein